MTDDTDKPAVDGTVEIDPERVAWMLKLNDSLDPRNNDRRVVKVYNGIRGWTAQIVRQQEETHHYPNSNPSFVPPFAFLDTVDPGYYAQPPQRRHAPDDVTDEEHEEVVAVWTDDVITAVGGTITLGQRSDDPTVLRVVPESND